MSVQKVSALCAEAVGALQRGNPALAEKLALQASQLQAGDFNVLSVLALSRFQLGHLNQAMETMGAAIKVNGAIPSAWGNLGSMQLAAGQKADALASFERAIALGARQPELFCNCGNLLVESGRQEEAVQRFNVAVTLTPGLMPAWLGLANARLALGQHAQALQDCERALKLAPSNPAVLTVCAAALLALSRHQEALDCIEQSLRMRPDAAAAWSNKASALLGLDRFEEALQACDKALGFDGGHVEALTNRAAALNFLHRPDEALVACDAALARKPELLEAHVNRATSLRHMERYEEALEGTAKALASGIVNSDLLRCRGVILSDLGRQAEAISSFDDAIALDPSGGESKFGKAQLLMQRGDFETGLPLYEERKRLAAPTGTRQFPQPLWLGRESLSGKTILVHREQGIGDAIMFSRFAAPLAAQGAKVVLGVPEKLRQLFASFTLDAQITDAARPAVPFDYHIPLASLPLALGLRIDSVPASIPYLRAEPARVEKWKRYLGEGGIRIGIAWQGARVGNDVGRSVPLSAFAGIASVPGVRLISLQKGYGAEQMRTQVPGFAVESLGDDFDSGPDAFLDAAAVMEACDLVISTDTAIAHLAGALGRPVWIALRHSPEWRWFLSRSDSPWYPTAELFRQSMAGEWQPVFQAMEARLRAGQTG